MLSISTTLFEKEYACISLFCGAREKGRIFYCYTNRNLEVFPVLADNPKVFFF